MHILISRSDVIKELRYDVPVVQPLENNPFAVKRVLLCPGNHLFAQASQLLCLCRGCLYSLILEKGLEHVIEHGVPVIPFSVQFSALLEMSHASVSTSFFPSFSSRISFIPRLNPYSASLSLIS